MKPWFSTVSLIFLMVISWNGRNVITAQSSDMTTEMTTDMSTAGSTTSSSDISSSTPSTGISQASTGTSTVGTSATNTGTASTSTKSTGTSASSASTSSGTGNTTTTVPSGTNSQSSSTSPGSVTTTTTSTPITSPVIPNTPFSVPANGIATFQSQVSLQEPLVISVQVDSGSLNNIFVSLCPSDVENGIYGYAIYNISINGPYVLSVSDLQVVSDNTLPCKSKLGRSNGGVDRAALNDLATTIFAGTSGVAGSLSASQKVPNVQTTTTIPIPTTSTIISNTPFSIPANGVNTFKSQVSLLESLDFVVQIDNDGGSIANMFVSFCPTDVVNGIYGYAIYNGYENIHLSALKLQYIYTQTYTCKSQMGRANDGIDRAALYDLTITILAGGAGAEGILSASQTVLFPQDKTTTTSTTTTTTTTASSVQVTTASSGLSGGAVAAIIVGCILVAVLVLVGVIAVIVYINSQNAKSSHGQHRHHHQRSHHRRRSVQDRI